MIKKKATIYINKEQFKDDLLSDQCNYRSVLFEILRDFLMPEEQAGFSEMKFEIVSNPDNKCDDLDTMVFVWAFPDFNASKDYKKCITLSKTYTFDEPKHENNTRYNDFVESFIYFDIIHRTMKFLGFGKTCFPRGLTEISSLVVNLWREAPDIFPLIMGFDDWIFWEDMAVENFTKRGLTLNAEYDSDGELHVIVRDPKKLSNREWICH
jgi:hypothetical protein